MKLVSFTAAGRSSYGIVVGDKVIDLGRQLGPSHPTLRAAIASDAFGSAAVGISSAEPDLPLADVKLLPPITDPDKIICIGLNYKAHAAEGGFKIPEFPSLFARLTSSRH